MKINFEKSKQPGSSFDKSDAPSDSELNHMMHQSYYLSKQTGNETFDKYKE